MQWLKKKWANLLEVFLSQKPQKMLLKIIWHIVMVLILNLTDLFTY